MKPERNSERLLGITRSKAKMYEYHVPIEDHIDLKADPARLFTLTIGLLGDLAAEINSKNEVSVQLPSPRKELAFSARFFDAYCQARLNEAIDPYVLLLASASYYLSDLPGSAAVLASRIPVTINFNCGGLERFLRWLLVGDFSVIPDMPPSQFQARCEQLILWMQQYFGTGEQEQRGAELLLNLRNHVYMLANDRELLFADIACAIAVKRRDNSSWYCLPRLTEQPVSSWKSVLQKESFVRELWPAQRLLGEMGILKGKSGVVQMPTSAGKTRATELIIRSAFLGGRTELAVIVAPFRALCHEISNSLAFAFQGELVSVDELTDVMQLDLDFGMLLEGKRVVVLTPEKLVYILRQDSQLATNIGLLIYDEGHQFDNGSRGVTYELLVTSLKSLILTSAQTVLISAVIANADAINSWLNGSESVIVSGSTLIPTFRTIAFSSWETTRGRLEFVSSDDPEATEFFVPRILERIRLPRKPRERTDRYFPEKDDGPAVALFLGLKAVESGSVAIFCGTKVSAASLCAQAVDIYERDYAISPPASHSDSAEIARLKLQIVGNLGTTSVASRSADIGVFAHHGNTPHGIRLAIEHAMKENLIKFVICTSTLAQGVNLPIRYLIVSSTKQGVDRLKVRDFHNLIGRSGRSGMHTEGTIIFANPDLFDNRNVKSESWRWREAQRLLRAENSEPCASSLLSVFGPVLSDKFLYQLEIDFLSFARAYIEDPDQVSDLIEGLARREPKDVFSIERLRKQIEFRLHVLDTVESYLMAYWNPQDNSREEDGQTAIDRLAKGTLAYHLGTETERADLLALFEMLSEHVARSVPDAAKRIAFARTLYGVGECVKTEIWVASHAEEISNCATDDELLALIWPRIWSLIRNENVKKCSPAEPLLDVALGWISGRAFHTLHQIVQQANVRFGTGERARYPTIEHMVEICENGFGYDGMLAVGAIAEAYAALAPRDRATLGSIRRLQKRLKYGLASTSEIIVYELGFADRVIASDLTSELPNVSSRKTALQTMKRKQTLVLSVLDKYPSYFLMVLKRLIT